MTVSSGYENKGYDGDNPVKVSAIENFANYYSTETNRLIFYCLFFRFSFLPFIVYTASDAKYRGYCIDKRKSQINAGGEMEDIEKCVHFIVSFYGSIYSVSGNFGHLFLLI